jgi:hypothetical protein
MASRAAATYPSEQAKQYQNGIILFLESHLLQVEESLKVFVQVPNTILSANPLQKGTL